MIAITARPARGFWRCGVHHPAARTLHADDRFTAAQLEELKAEVQLIVEVLLDDPGLKQSLGEGGAPKEPPPGSPAPGEKDTGESGDQASSTEKKPFWARGYFQRADGTREPIEFSEGETSPGTEEPAAPAAPGAEVTK